MKTKISRDLIHDQLAATYQSIEAGLLNEALLKNGITDTAQREKIIEAFLFSQGIMLDQYWFKEQDTRWYPGVYFSTKPHDEISAATIYLPSEEYGMNFHTYAGGAATWAVENQSTPDAIEVGNDLEQ